MNPITRRTLIRRGAATAALATLASGALVPSAAVATAPSRQPALFVFDARFSRSVALAHSHRANGADLLDPRADDLGVAWRGRIPGLLDQGAAIEGLTLWSDRLICEIFARDAGVAFHATSLSAASGAPTQLYHWWLG